MKNTGKFFGLSIAEAAQRSNVPTVTIWRHAHKKRKISPEYALLYNKTLGIPLYLMRPDLWPKQQGEAE